MKKILSCLCLLLVALAGAAASSPVSRPAYPVLAEFLAYDRELPLNAKVVQVKDDQGSRIEKITFGSTHGEVVPALLTIPAGKAKPPFPCVLILHGYHGSKDEALPGGFLLAATGRASLAIDAQYHGERVKPGVDVYSSLLYRNRDALIQTVVDARRAIDYLETRPDIDSRRIGLVGASMGGILGAVLAGVEPRIKVPVLLVAGADWGLLAEKSQISAGKQLREGHPNLSFDQVARILAPVDPLNFADKISPRPLLMLNGKHDDIVPVESNQLLYDRAKQPKQIIWFESGHLLPMLEAIPRIVEWLDKYL